MFVTNLEGAKMENKVSIFAPINSKIIYLLGKQATRTAIRPSVRPSIRPSVRPSSRPSVRPFIRPWDDDRGDEDDESFSLDLERSDYVRTDGRTDGRMDGLAERMAAPVY